MARINFEEFFWFDPRTELLISKVGKFKAIGMLCCFWKLAQVHWTNKEKPCSLIPEKVFKLSGLTEELFECEFAERRSEGIYAKGSEKNFEWLFKRRESGRKGGQANAKQIEAGAKLVLSKSKQIEASSSFSFSNTKKTTLAHTEFDFEEILNKFPKRNGSLNKKKAINLFNNRIRSKEQIIALTLAVKNYAAWCEREGKVGTEFVMQLSTFANCWEEWSDKSIEKKKPIDFTDGDK